MGRGGMEEGGGWEGDKEGNEELLLAKVGELEDDDWREAGAGREEGGGRMRRGGFGGVFISYY